jgi:hypothetical protein
MHCEARRIEGRFPQYHPWPWVTPDVPGGRNLEETMVCRMLRNGKLCFAVLVTGLAAFTHPVKAQEKSQATFASPDEAVKALVSAAKAQDTRELTRIFGASSRTMVESGDPVEDKDNLKQFVERAEKNVSITGEGKTRMVYFGLVKWPLPFPLRNSSGKWYFDSQQGRREAVKRRVGQNEIEAMQVCRAIAAAEKIYIQADRNNDGVMEYATKFRSKPGQQNGLYWESKPGEPESPLGPLIARAESEGYQGHLYHSPYHGYFFRILQGQGPHALGGAHSYIVNGHMLSGYAILAHPAHWGSSGVMTFILNQDGKLYERNLGPQTAQLVPAVKVYDPDRNWHLVKE